MQVLASNQSHVSTNIFWAPEVEKEKRLRLQGTCIVALRLSSALTRRREVPGGSGGESIERPAGEGRAVLGPPEPAAGETACSCWYSVGG
jgi:hypothetical protein